MNNKEILLLGDIMIDTICPVSEFPTPGRDEMAPDLNTQLGGSVVNSAVVLDHLEQPVTLLGAVGKDIWAELVRTNLDRTGINQHFIQTKSASKTGFAFIIVSPDGERTMFSYRGSNPLLDVPDISEEAFYNAEILHISGYALLQTPQRDAAWRAVELVKKHHLQISLDTALEPVIHNPDCVRNFLPELTICITSPQEVTALLNCSLDEAIPRLLDSGVELLAIKQAEQGSLLLNQNEKFFCPSFPIKAVDSTGAGDSFTAGLLYARMNGLSLPAAGILASALGALAASVQGAGLSLPGKQQALDFLKNIRSSQLHNIPQRYFDEIITATNSI